MSLIIQYDIPHGIVQRIPEPANTGTQLIVLFDNNIKLPSTPFNIAIYPSALLPLAGSAEISRVILVQETGVGTHILTIQRKTQGDVSRFVQVGDQVLCAVTSADLFAVKVGNAERLSIINSNTYIRNDGGGGSAGVSLSIGDYINSKLPSGLDPITAAELVNADIFPVEIAAEGKVKGLPKSELSILANDAISNYAAFGETTPYPYGNLKLVGYDRYVVFGVANFPIGFIWAIPVIEKAGNIISKLGLRKNISTNFHARAGLYSDLGTNRQPANLLSDFGEMYFPGTLNGLAYFSEPPLPYTFPYTGIYWYVLTVYANPINLKCVLYGHNPILGYNDPHTAGCDVTLIIGLKVAFGYNNLPESFPANPSSVLAGAAPSMPAMFKLYSAV